MVDYKDYDKKSYHAGFQDGYAEAKEIFKRPHGEWGSHFNKYFCSNCECIRKDKTIYCPNCGAKMKQG